MALKVQWQETIAGLVRTEIVDSVLRVTGYGEGDPPQPDPTGRTFHVSPNGSDLWPGSSSQPWRTIQHAVNRLSAGDALIVRAGTYVEAVTVSCSGTAANRIYILCQPGAVLDGQVGVASLNSGLPGGAVGLTDPVSGKIFTYHALLQISGDYVTLNGLEVIRSRGRGIEVHRAGDRPTGVVIQNCVVHDIRAGGIRLTDADHVTVDSCRVYDCSNFATYNRAATTLNWPGACVMQNSSYCTWSNNEVYHNWGEGMHTGQYGCTHGVYRGNIVWDNYALGIYIGRAQHMLVERNLLYYSSDTTYYRGSGPCHGIIVNDENHTGRMSSRYITIQNNIVVGYGRGIGAWMAKFGPLRDVSYLHNTVVNSVDYGIAFIGRDFSNVVVKNNLVRTGGTGAMVSFAGGDGITFDCNNWSHPPAPAAVGPHDIVSDPLLVDPDHALTGGDIKAGWYRLTAKSPGVRQAAVTLVGEDFWGTERTLLPDVGAHEYSRRDDFDTALHRAASLPGS